MSRKWLWTYLGLFLVLALGISIPLGIFLWNRHQEIRRGDERIAEVIAEIEKSDPNWQWEELWANRPPVPADRNIVDLVDNYPKLLEQRCGQGIDAWRRLLGEEPRCDWDELPAQRWLDELSEARKRIEPAFALVHEMATRGRLQAAPVPPDVPWRSNIHYRVTLPAELLEAEVIRLASTGQSEDVLPLIDDVLSLAESLQDEPTRVAMSTRLTLRKMAIDMLARTLALSELQDAVGLLALSARLDRISRRPVALPSLRGTRATWHEHFLALEEGREPLERYRPDGQPWQNFKDELADRLDLRFRHAEMLHRMTLLIRIAEKPPTQWESELARSPPWPPNRDYEDLELELSNLEWYLKDESENRARIACARAAIASELFRLRHQRWPDSHGEIPPELLPSRPVDPDSGRPLTIVRWESGIKIEVGEDPFRYGTWIAGFNLYDPEFRGRKATRVWIPKREFEKLIEDGQESWESYERLYKN